MLAPAKKKSQFQPAVVAFTSYPAKMFPIILQPNDYSNERPEEKHTAKNRCY